MIVPSVTGSGAPCLKAGGHRALRSNLAEIRLRFVLITIVVLHDHYKYNIHCNNKQRTGKCISKSKLHSGGMLGLLGGHVTASVDVPYKRRLK